MKLSRQDAVWIALFLGLVGISASGVLSAPLLAVRAAGNQAFHGWIKDPGVIRSYLESHKVRKLQIGAGGQDAEGWLNSDYEPAWQEVFLDASARFPVPDASFHYVYAEQMIEHVPWEGGLAMLRECHRTMVQGGKLRLTTPDLAKLASLLSSPATPDVLRFMEGKVQAHHWPVTPIPAAYIVNRQMRDFGHVFLYDAPALRKTLELAGFRQITQLRLDDKTDPVFLEAETRTRNPGTLYYDYNVWESMAFEATR
jgi:predicted SAM-dependent methyltransferase